jgi:integrase
MVRTTGRLTAIAVQRARKPGLYADGGGLYLQLSGAAGRSWIFRYMLRGKAGAMGLGSVADVPLARARALAQECRRELQQGIDPIGARKAREAEVRLASATAKTFQQCAESYIKAHRAGWRNTKHAYQWAATLATYAYPVFGSLPVAAIDVGLIMKALEPIWQEKTETASRLRGRIESVLDWATVRGYRKGDNPARWRGQLQSLLPSRARVRRVEHYPALPYIELGTFMASLRAQEGIAAKALEFLILTVTRTGETIGARWDEFNLDEAMWVVPPARIKAGREHRVPLSAPALGIVRDLAKTKLGDSVFPGRRTGKPLSDMALLALLIRSHQGACGESRSAT